MVNELKKLLFSKRRLTIAAISFVVYIVFYLIFRYYNIDENSLNPVINRFGQLNFFTVFLLQLLFSLTPLPDTLVTYISVVILGAYRTFFSIYLAMLLASIIHYWIARKFGPGLVYKLFPKTKKRVESFNGQLDTHHLILYRFFAMISFDVVPYVAGFGGVKFKSFFVSTALGLIPMIIPNILLAHGLVTNNFFWTLVLWGSAGAIMFVLSYLIKRFY